MLKVKEGSCGLERRYLRPCLHMDKRNLEVLK